MLHNSHCGYWGLKQWPSLLWHIMPVIYVTPKKNKHVESNRMLLCSHQTYWNSLLALTWWLAVNNPISFPQSGPQPVFGHARFSCSCETSLRENLRVERVPLIPGTDRGHTGSSLWELQFVRAMTQQLCQKVKKKRLMEWMLSWLQKNTLYYKTKFTAKEGNKHYLSVDRATHEPLRSADF